MAELLTASYTDMVKLGTVLWLQTVDSLPMPARTSGMFKVMPIADNTGDKREVSEIETEEYASLKNEGDQAARADVAQGYSKTLTLKRVAKDIGISWEWRKRGKYPEITAALTSLAKMGHNALDLDMTHMITFGADGSYTDRDGETIDTTTGDSQNLFATGHTLTSSSTTYRNLLANNPKFSKGALELMERQIVENTYNNFGQKMAITFDIIFTTDEPTTVNAVREFLKSSADPNATHSGVANQYRGKYRHVVLPRLATDASGAPDTDKRYYWGLCSSSMNQMFVAIDEEPHMKVGSGKEGGSAEDFASDTYNFGVRAGYGRANASGRGIHLSKGDGSA